jgi:hypothetical protein
MFARITTGFGTRIAVLLLLGWTCLAHAAEMRRISATITYRIPEGIYVNVGRDQGLEQGQSGSMVLEEGRTWAFEVVQAARSSALLRIEGMGSNLVGSLQNRRIELLVEQGGDTARQAGALAKAPKENEPFVPLLAASKRAVAVAPTQNISHGYVGIRQTYQGGTANQLDYAATRLYTSGNIDRLFGTAWSFVWSGNARYRTGDGYRYHPEYGKLQPLVYALQLQHPLSGDGFVRMGRFLPLELPAIGYIDGGQVEVDTAGHWSFGGVGGLKPDRLDLTFSTDEPTAVGYATYEAGKRGDAYYSGTAGLLASLFKGEPDRLAVLFDQRGGFGPRFDLYSTAEIDTGLANTTNSQAQLSHFDLVASSRLHQLFTLRGGADHWQRADTLVLRDQLPSPDDRLFDDGYWRYWIGARHDLPWHLDLNEELAYIVSDASDDAMRWRMGLTRTGLFGWNFASVGATLYNLEGQASSGYGGLLRAYFPFLEGRLSVSPSASLRWLDPDNGGDGLSVTYYSVYGDYRISKAWMLTGGLTATRGDGADAILFDAGLRYSW